MADARERPDYDVPVHLRNAPTRLMKEMGYGQGIAMPMMSQTPMLPGSLFPRKWLKLVIIGQQIGARRENWRKARRLTEQDQNSPIKRYR